jgi:hypothetical protein
MDGSHLLHQGGSSFAIIFLILAQARQNRRRKHIGGIQVLDTIEKIECQPARIQPGQGSPPLATAESQEFRDTAATLPVS